MLKTFTIVCLFALLAVGATSCEKDKGCDPPFLAFVIDDSLNYNTDNYIVNTALVNFPSDNSTIYYDIDLDGVNDLMLVKTATDSSDGWYYIIEKLHTLPADSSIAFYGYSNTGMEGNRLGLYYVGDTVQAKNLELLNNNFMNRRHQMCDIGEYFFDYWGYAIFRKQVGNSYKYGWVRINKGSNCGPSVMQR